MDTMTTADLALLAMDWAQTRQIARACKVPSSFYEQNMVLGHCPSIGRVNNYFIASGALTITLANTLKEPYKTSFLISLGVVETGAILHNLSIGLQIKF